MRFRARTMMAFAALALLAAGSTAPSISVNELMRRASIAVDAGELAEADSLLRQAEERTIDPGMVAFNRGVVQMRRGSHREAELLFRRSLADAEVPAPRRARALYNLGTCMVRQASETDLAQLQAAIECFEFVLQEAPEDAGLQADARHNLEVAKLLWAKARAKRPNNEPEPEWSDPEEARQQPPGPNVPKEEPGDGPDGKKPAAMPKVDPSKGKDPGIAAKETPKPVPGQGNLPVIPDTDEVPLLSAEDARTVLDQAMERSRRERQRLREEAAQGDRPRANDW